jgi:rhomboid protease GluP
MAAWGISPYRKVTIPLEDYNPDHYLTLLYQAMLNRGWDIGYFDHDGIIAYTPISWSSYSEEVSARIVGNTVVIKSECVGFQGLFTDYGKNQENIDVLLGEIEYADFHMQGFLEENTRELMNSVPEKQFLNLDDPPMAGKELLHGFFSPFVPKKKYLITPILVIANVVIFMTTTIILYLIIAFFYRAHPNSDQDIYTKAYLSLGFSSRPAVLKGDYWRLFTSMFLHFNILHVLLNMVVLVYIGSLIESKLGKWNFLMVYLFTGLIASMVSVMWHDNEISAGASGAIFGLFGVLLAFLSTDFYERSARKALLISTAIVVAYNIIPLGKGVDHAAHLGGLVSGYIFGWLTYLGLTHKNRFIKKWGMALVGSITVIVFVSCGVKFSTRYQTKQYAALNEKITQLSHDIDAHFYTNTYSSHEEKLDSIQQKALPEARTLYKIAAQLETLKLSSQRTKEAHVRAKLIRLQCQLYHFLYLEFKDQGNEMLYRYDIQNITDSVNTIRIAWHNDGN